MLCIDVRFEAIDVRFEAVEKNFETRFTAIEKNLQEVKVGIRRLEVQLNQLIISLVGKEKAIVIKKQAEDLFAETRPVVRPIGKNKKHKRFLHVPFYRIKVA